MEKATGLIGYTGFVGSNLLSSRPFDQVYNSKNIQTIRGKSFSLLICAGVYANKWWANENGKEDLENIKELIALLKTVTVDRFVLISTIDVYPKPVGVDETTMIDKSSSSPYGLNRYFLEEFVQSTFKNKLIVRLPGLFGKGLRKNFIYDLLNPLPQIIKPNKMLELTSRLDCSSSALLLASYENLNGYYKLKADIEKACERELLKVLEAVAFTSKNFTDSRSLYQFYDLKNLSRDIDMALSHDISLLNLSVEGMSASYIAKKIFNIDFENLLENSAPALYDFKSIHADTLFHNKDYLYGKEETLKSLSEFIREVRENEPRDF